MGPVSDRLVVDCSVVVKWKLMGEPHTTEAEALFLDWRHQAVQPCAPALLAYEVVSAFLVAYRRGRISAADAADFIRDLLTLPFTLYELTPSLALRAFEMARQHARSAYDCAYVALAEQQMVE